MKGTKYMAKGGSMKGTKYMAKGGSMKGTKYMAKGGAALQSEMKANPGMGNMPASVMSKLMGAVTPKKGVLKDVKKAMSQKAKGTKYRAKGGKV
tara:strand:+ start:956 stop:1237 length:282 start_codon:yes stop_codon:yes gene_type:complete